MSATRVRRIHLVRHGRSAHVPQGWLDAAGIVRWLDDYDAAGVAADDRPPEALRAIAAGAGVIAASDMPRALASARLLAPHASPHVSPLLREVRVTVPALARVRLPVAGWALAVGVGAAWRALRGVRPPDAVRAQAAAAAAWLARLADAHGEVLAVTHANLRPHVAVALGAHGWRRAPGGARLAHWSAWTLLPESPP